MWGVCLWIWNLHVKLGKYTEYAACICLIHFFALLMTLLYNLLCSCVSQATALVASCMGTCAFGSCQVGSSVYERQKPLEAFFARLVSRCFWRVFKFPLSLYIYIQSLELPKLQMDFISATYTSKISHSNSAFQATSICLAGSDVMFFPSESSVGVGVYSIFVVSFSLCITCSIP